MYVKFTLTVDRSVQQRGKIEFYCGIESQGAGDATIPHCKCCYADFVMMPVTFRFDDAVL